MFSWSACKSLFIVLLLEFLNSNKCEEDRPRALVFGGNGFMGVPTVEKLLIGGYHVTIVNRGNWYWDSEIKIKPRVSHVTCDRYKPLSQCKNMKALHNFKFDVVVDFSAYERFQIHDVFDVFQDRIGLYILISSDSVYEVCNKSHDGYTREIDAVRPRNVLQREKYAKKDNYGHRKLLCEEELHLQNMKWGVPFISLRLPDVMGPRDNTYRWWIYQLQIRLHAQLNNEVRVPNSECHQPLSLVHCDDVAELIVDICSQGPEKFAHGKSYNLAFKENPTLLQLLEAMKSELHMQDVPITCSEESVPKLYPTVTLGPVDTTSADQELSWNPTTLSEAVKDNVNFYESAARNPELQKELSSALDFTKMAMSLSNGYGDKLYDAFNKEYRTTDSTIRDEL
jgi:nucleoside-diphosphate-sugar epimerase